MVSDGHIDSPAEIEVTRPRQTNIPQTATFGKIPVVGVDTGDGTVLYSSEVERRPSKSNYSECFSFQMDLSDGSVGQSQLSTPETHGSQPLRSRPAPAQSVGLDGQTAMTLPPFTIVE
jgi:hypothetical protein